MQRGREAAPGIARATFQRGDYWRVVRADGTEQWWVRSSNQSWIALTHRRVIPRFGPGRASVHCSCAVVALRGFRSPIGRVFACQCTTTVYLDTRCTQPVSEKVTPVCGVIVLMSLARPLPRFSCAHLSR
jgi:hypothetical protein